MTTTSLTRKKASRSSAAARARSVIGPIAAMVMVPGSLSRRSWRISWCEGVVLGSKRCGCCNSVEMSWGGSVEEGAASAGLAVEVGRGWEKRDCHADDGVRWGCWMECMRVSCCVREFGILGRVS